MKGSAAFMIEIAGLATGRVLATVSPLQARA